MHLAVLEVCLQIFEDKKLTGQLPYILIFYMYMQGRRRRNIGETFTGFPGNFAKRVEGVAAARETKERMLKINHSRADVIFILNFFSETMLA